MSIQQVAWVLENERLTSGRERLVLLAIANHDGDGGSWPSVATLASEAGCSERSVQYALRELQRLGVIEIIQRGGGTQNTRDDRRPNRYVIVHRRGAEACTPSDSRGATSFATGCKETPNGVQQLAPEPSLTVHEPANRNRKSVDNVSRIPRRDEGICVTCHGSGWFIPDTDEENVCAQPCGCSRSAAS